MFESFLSFLLLLLAVPTRHAPLGRDLVDAPHVLTDACPGGKSGRADRAWVRLLARVLSLVRLESRSSLQHLAAMAALERGFKMFYSVHLQMVIVINFEVAEVALQLGFVLLKSVVLHIAV